MFKPLGIDVRRRPLFLSLGRLAGLGPWPALLFLLILALVLEPRFFQPSNLQNILQQASILGIVTMGQVLVLLTAGIDLSVGAIIGLTAVAIADSSAPGGPGLAVGLAVMFVFACMVGLTNGLLITKRNVPPFVATFGMFVALEGARVAYTRGSVSGAVPEVIRSLGRGTVIGIPSSTLVLVLLIAGLVIFLERSVGGRRLVMMGANERMAALSGISVTKIKVLAYVGCTLLAVLAGVFFAGDVGYVDRFIGRGTDLDSIAAAFIGGAKFSGGEGSFIHAAGGALLIVVLLNLIVVTGLNIELQLVAKGLLLIGAVALQLAPWRRSNGPKAAIFESRGHAK